MIDLIYVLGVWLGSPTAFAGAGARPGPHQEPSDCLAAALRSSLAPVTRLVIGRSKSHIHCETSHVLHNSSKQVRQHDCRMVRPISKQLVNRPKTGEGFPRSGPR